METVKVRKSVLRGCVKAPPSKSETHRALIMASLAEGESLICNPLICDDTLATLNALEKFGIKVREGETSIRVEGGRLNEISTPIYCSGSGTTLRFVTALSSLVNGVSVLTGSPSLMRRPHQPLLDALNLLGVETDFDGERIRVRSNGSLCGAELYLPSNISSQFVSALLMIAPRAKSDISIKLPSPLESKHYAEMTVRMQKQFGVFSFVNADFTQFRIYPQRYKPSEISIEGDWSSAAFLLAAGAMSGGVSVSSLNMDSLQPDRRILDALIKMGVNVKIVADTVAVDRRTPLSPLEFDVRDSPDLLPVLSVLCSAADGVSRVSGISRNRLKESDRVKSVCEGLRRCGITVKESEDELTIFGIGNKRGEWGENRTVAIESYNDHRIVMAFAVLGLVLDDGIVIEGADSVTKSFPQFFDTLSFLGACLEILK